MNREPFDSWTLAHLLAGMGAGALTPMGPGGWLILHSAYELVEQGAERTPAVQRAFGTSGPESARNVLADTGVAMLGYALGRLMRG